MAWLDAATLAALLGPEGAGRSRGTRHAERVSAGEDGTWRYRFDDVEVSWTGEDDELAWGG